MFIISGGEKGFTENGKISYLPAKSGLNVKLTIDFDVQYLCDKVAIKKDTTIILLISTFVISERFVP